LVRRISEDPSGKDIAYHDSGDKTDEVSDPDDNVPLSVQGKCS